MKDVLLTFDYELFFVDSGSIDDCLIRPVNDILEYLKKYNYRATFFVDTVYLNRLQCVDYEGFNRIKLQLEQIVKEGNRIELHLHPHWIDAVYDNSISSWHFPTYEHYMLSSLTNEQIDKLFREGISLLNDVARCVNPNYTVMAFRAGGWCIEPFSKIRPFFEKYGLVVDTSVAKDVTVKNGIHSVDFTSAPNASHYRFSSSSIIEESKGTFFEFPISTNYISYMRLLYNAFNKKKLDKDVIRIYGNGKGITTNSCGNSYFRMLFFFIAKKNRLRMFSLDGTIIPNQLIKLFDNDERRLITLISHPKSITKNALHFLEKASIKDWNFLNIKEAYDKYNQ